MLVGRAVAEKPEAFAQRYYPAGVLVGSFIYLYANLFARLQTPFLLGGDQALFWTNAQRLLHGELIYRDFLEFTPPGTDLIYLGAFRLLGSRIWVPNLVVLLLGVALCWLCFHLARSIMKPAHAALAAASFMVLDYGRILNGTHHWFSVLAVMGSVAVLLKAPTPRRIVIAGSLLGVAAFFTQTRGPLAALAVGGYLLWDRLQRQQPWSLCLKNQLLLWVSLAATWGALSSYFIVQVGFWQLWYFQVTYVLRYVTSGPGGLSVGSPDIRAWLMTPLRAWLMTPAEARLYLLVYCTVPIVYAMSWYRCVRGSGKASLGDPKSIVLLTFVGMAMFAEVAQSPNSIRLYCVVMPGIILFFQWLSVSLKGTWRGYATTAMWIGLVCLAVHQGASRHRQQTVIADLPAGRIATSAATGEKLLWLARHTTPGQLLFEARWVDVYLPLALRNPVFTDMLEGGHNSRPEFINLSIRQLATQRVQYIIWAPRLQSPAYPYAKFHDFLVDRYRPIWTFADQDQVWELE